MMYSLRYNLPGILLLLMGLTIFLSIFMQALGAGWGPPFFWAYPVFLVLFILSAFVKVGPPPGKTPSGKPRK